MEDGNGPSLPPPGDGNHGDEKKANDEASAATSKTPEVENDGDGDKASMFTPTLEQPTSPFRAVEETEAGQQGSTPAVENDGDEDKANSQDVGITKETPADENDGDEDKADSQDVGITKEKPVQEQTNDVQQRSALPLQTPGSGKNEESSAKPTVGPSGKLDNGATQPSIQAEDHDTGAYQQVAPQVRCEETVASQTKLVVAIGSQQLSAQNPAAMFMAMVKGMNEDATARHREKEVADAKRHQEKLDADANHHREKQDADAKHHREKLEADAKHNRQREEAEAKRHQEYTKLAKQQQDEKQILEDRNIGLQDQADQLCKDLDATLTHAEKLERQLHAEKHKKGQLQERLKRLLKQSDDDRESPERLKWEREAEKREKALQELVKRLRKDMEDAQHVHWLDKEREAQLQELVTQLRKESDDARETVNRLQKEMDAAKPYMPENQERYTLNPFTGLAIVVCNEERALEDTLRLAKVLLSYGFEVKPIRNPKEKEFYLDELEECDAQWEEHNLVLIFIVAHGKSTAIRMANSYADTDSSQWLVAASLKQRMENGKPTILCMSSCRDHAEGANVSELDILDDDQPHLFLVNARRLGFRTSREDHAAFVDGLVKIFQGKMERSFLTAIGDLRRPKGNVLQNEKLDYDDRLRKCLVLPAFPARTWQPEKREENDKLLETVFKYEHMAAQISAAATS